MPDKPETSESPGQLFEPEGYIYVLQFSSGRVKVGYTADIKARLTAHNSSAKVHGIRIEEKWVSPFHKEARFNEKRLIGFCRSVVGAEYTGEYFTGVSFATAVEFASSELTITRTTRAASDRERSKAAERAERTRVLDAYESATRPGRDRQKAALESAGLELKPLALWFRDPVANAMLRRLHDGDRVPHKEIWDALGKYVIAGCKPTPELPLGGEA
jgi:hypothetical protein